MASLVWPVGPFSSPAGESISSPRGKPPVATTSCRTPRNRCGAPGADDDLGGAGRCQEPPGTVPARHSSSSAWSSPIGAISATRIRPSAYGPGRRRQSDKQVSWAHGGPPEARLGVVWSAEQYCEALANGSRTSPSLLRPVHRVRLAHGRTAPPRSDSPESAGDPSAALPDVQGGGVHHARHLKRMRSASPFFIRALT
jgi:hypothetical protein